MNRLIFIVHYMKGGRIPVYQNNLFVFDGEHNVIFKKNFIYKTANETAPTIVLDNHTFEYREAQPGETETANANLEKEQSYNTNFKDCDVLKNNNAEIVLDYISVFNDLESDVPFITKYGNLGMDSIFTYILNCKESDTETHKKFIESLKPIFIIQGSQHNYAVGGLNGKFNLFHKYSFIDELKTLITILMGDTNNTEKIKSMLLGTTKKTGKLLESTDDFNIKYGKINDMLKKRTRKMSPQSRLETYLLHSQHENPEKKSKNANKTQKTRVHEQLTPQQQRFVNICDFMRVNYIYTENKEIKPLQKSNPGRIFTKEQLDTMPYEEYIRHIYQTNIDNRTDLNTYNVYVDREIKEILNLKTNVFDYLKNTHLRFKFNAADDHYVKYRDTNIAKEIGIDLASFIILYYIKLRFDKPKLEMNHRTNSLYPISKKLFIDTLIGKENNPIIKNDENDGFNFDLYPKETMYAVNCRVGPDRVAQYSECAGRGLFEIVKFIALGEDNQFHSEYFPDTTLAEVKALFEKYNTFENMKSNESVAFSEFMEILNNKGTFGLKYSRGDHELTSVEMNSYLNYVFNGSIKYNNNTPNIVNKSPITNKIVFENQKITLENPHFILTVIHKQGHTETKYLYKSKIFYNNVEFANNMYLRFLIFKQIEIKRLNSKKITNMHRMFARSGNVIENLSDLDVSNVTNMTGMFSECHWLNQPLNWDVSKVTNMSFMFSGCENFDQPLNWNVSNVTIMSIMFDGCESFNQPLNWDVSKVTSMATMFAGCTNFNQPLNWDVSNVTNMSFMFYSCMSFNQLLNWNVSKVTYMENMFNGCTMFNQPLNWDVSNVTNMENMLYGCSSFNQPLNWNVSKVTNMTSMFNGCTMFNQPLNWNVSKVTNMTSMFKNCTKFDQPLNSWEVSNVTNMSDMFKGCESFNQPLDSWDVSNVTNMSAMFGLCSEFNQPLDSWIVSNVTNMKSMFTRCINFNQLLNWNVSNVTNMSAMFGECSEFNQPLDSWIVSNVTDMSYMFYGCSNFNQPLDSWDVSNVTNMSAMFYGARSFNQPLNSWNLKSLTNMNNMFKGSKMIKENLPISRPDLISSFRGGKLTRRIRRIRSQSRKRSKRYST